MSGAPSPASFLPPGLTFFRILGQGGGGWVALAVEDSIGRLVAVKALPGANPRSRARLRREAQALAGLVHPNVVRAFALTSWRDDWFIVMEYVPGGDLPAGLAAGTIGGAQAVRILRDTAAAIDYAHR